MKIREVIERRIRRQVGGVNVASDVNAVVAANVNERGRSSTHVSSRQTVVQRSTRDDADTDPKKEGE